MRIIIEGGPDKISTIKRRFRSFGVTFIDDNGVLLSTPKSDLGNELLLESLKLENEQLKKVLAESVGLETDLLEVKTELEALKKVPTPEPTIEKPKGKSKK